MLGRYLLAGQAKYLQSRVATNTATTGTSTTQTWVTKYTGEPGSVMGMKVTTLTKSNVGGSYTVNGTTHILNDTFNLTLDGTGQVTITQVVNVGTTTPGNAINVVLTIMTTTIGTVATGGANQTTISKTI